MTEDERARLSSTILATQALLTAILSTFEDRDVANIVERARSEIRTRKPARAEEQADDEWLAIIRSLADEAVTAIAQNRRG